MLSQIEVGDGFAIKGYGGTNVLNVHLVGEVRAIDRNAGKITIKPWSIPLYSGSAPKIGFPGNWFRALTPVTSPQAIKNIFGKSAAQSFASSETGSRAKTFYGDQTYQVLARKALPLLVALAKQKETTYYKTLAKKLGAPNPRNMNYVLGSVGQTLIQLEKRWGTKIPPIQCLVINQAEELPGEGFGFFMDAADYNKLSLAEKHVAVNAIHEAVWAYPRWPEVLEALFLTISASPPSNSKPPTSGAGFGSSEHNRKVEKAAIDFVTQHLTQKGYKVESREKECIGYDLEAIHPKREPLHVEVKGVSGKLTQFPITANEVRRAERDPAFQLYVVTEATSGLPKLHRFSGADFRSRFELVPVSFIAARK